jgi:phosphoribosylformylglycinamidine cyclo-ligase
MGDMSRIFYDPTKPFGEQIREIIEKTHPHTDIEEIKVRRIGKRYAIRETSPFWNGFEKMTTTDGTGTKGSIIWKEGSFNTSGSNPFAMTVDDLYEHNFEPYKLQSHLILQEEKRDGILEAISSLKDLCLEFKWKSPCGTLLPIIISGGETAICDTIEGMEFAVTATGYAEPKDVLQAHAEIGDILIGIASDGIHSNGLTFARYGIFHELKMSLTDKLDWNVTIGEELSKPTRIYLKALKELNKNFGEYITGKVHITGGALRKLNELSKGAVSYEVINEHMLKPQPIFHFIYEKLKVPDEEMLTRFNCGIGYVISIRKEVAEDAINLLKRHFPADIIGKVVSGRNKIRIHSPFSNTVVKFTQNKV